MEYKVNKVKSENWGEVGVLGETYEPGIPAPEEEGKWRQKLGSRAEKLNYLKTGERYQYSEEGYGSEKRKNPA